jgi:para-aminobenzoate synthetase component 1
MNIGEFRSTLNEWGQQRVPFLFVVDFEMEKPIVWKADEINNNETLFDLNGVTNSNQILKYQPVNLEKFPIDLKDYEEKFSYVHNRLNYGDSFLTNLTFKTAININQPLKNLFYLSKAKYRLWLKDRFLVFSPETFVQINEGKIFSFPMKGTIDADKENARETILADRKELAEHVTIVDLIRNDISQIATNVAVSRFRYVEEIKTAHKHLLQVSSEVIGDLPSDYRDHLGDIIIRLLPAGSVSGAPKWKTLEIIKEAENERRGYYTGVMGYFDGKSLDSGVMIRFIEENDGQFFYRSGGGITTQSDMQQEYQEAIDKIYVPIN